MIDLHKSPLKVGDVRHRVLQFKHRQPVIGLDLFQINKPDPVADDLSTVRSVLNPHAVGQQLTDLFAADAFGNAGIERRGGGLQALAQDDIAEFLPLGVSPVWRNRRSRHILRRTR